MIKYAWTELKSLSQHLIECTAELKTIKRTLTMMLKGNHRQWLQTFELNFTKHFRSAKWFIISTSNSVSIQESVCPLCGEANSELETKLNSYFLLLLLSTGEPAEGFYCVEAIGNTMYLSQKLAQLRYQLVVTTRYGQIVFCAICFSWFVLNIAGWKAETEWADGSLALCWQGLNGCSCSWCSVQICPHLSIPIINRTSSLH